MNHYGDYVRTTVDDSGTHLVQESLESGWSTAYAFADAATAARWAQYLANAWAAMCPGAAGWLAENNDALGSSNTYVEQHGLPLAQYRT